MFSIRRGWEVYSQICSGCHGLGTAGFYHFLIDISHTVSEVKKIAAQHKIEDGVNELGEPKYRVRNVMDPMKQPYKNREEAKKANGGALPPSLGHICWRKEEQDVFFLSKTFYLLGASNHDINSCVY